MRRFLFFLTFALLTSLACSQSYTQRATETSVPATPISTFEPATQPPEVTPTALTDWLSQLEVITTGNWSRLQLLKTFPAEMPLNHSAVAISLDGKTMAVGSSSGAKIIFFDLTIGQLSQTVPVNGVANVDAYFNTIEYLPDGTIIANSDSPYEIYHIDKSGNVLSMWDGISFALTSDKKTMAYDKEGISLVAVTNNTPLLTLDDSDAMYFAFSPDGSKIAAENIGVDYLYTAIWEISTKTLLTKLDASSNPRFSPDGKYLVITKYDYKNNKTPVKIFSPDGATEVTTLDVPGPNALSNLPSLWSSDGSILIAQIANGPPVAWDTSNWQILDAPALQGELYSFSPDARILITRAPDGGILLWGVPSR